MRRWCQSRCRCSHSAGTGSLSWSRPAGPSARRRPGSRLVGRRTPRRSCSVSGRVRPAATASAISIAVAFFAHAGQAAEPEERRDRAPPVRPRARCAGRHQHPHHPRLLPGAAQALPARGRRGAGLRGAGRGRGRDPAAPGPGRADGGAGPRTTRRLPARRAGAVAGRDLDRRICRADEPAAGRARLAAGAHRATKPACRAAGSDGCAPDDTAASCERACSNRRSTKPALRAAARALAEAAARPTARAPR